MLGEGFHKGRTGQLGQRAQRGQSEKAWKRGTSEPTLAGEDSVVAGGQEAGKQQAENGMRE